MCSSRKLNDLQRATGVLQKCYRLPLPGTRENVHYTGGGLPLYSAHSLSFQVKEEEEERVLDNCQRSLPPICIPPTSPSPLPPLPTSFSELRDPLSYGHTDFRLHTHCSNQLHALQFTFVSSPILPPSPICII